MLTRRRLLRVLGYLQWLLSSTAICGPFLAAYYHLLQQGNIPALLPRRLWISLLNAWIGSVPSLHRRSLPPPCTMPIVYADAAPGDSSFVVASCKPRAFATSAPAPPRVRSRQSAELYAVFHTIRQLVLRSFTHACIVVDNAASYYTVLSGRVASACFDRIRILRRTNRLCTAARFQFQLALVRSEHNAADLCPSEPFRLQPRSRSGSNPGAVPAPPTTEPLLTPTLFSNQIWARELAMLRNVHWLEDSHRVRGLASG